ncbi:MAG: protein TolR [Pseudomonadota bacterium]
MRRQRRRSALIAEINVVPYIDVMLVLLIIFMITAPLLTQGVEVDLPQTRQTQQLQQAAEPPLIFSVDRAGDYYWQRPGGNSQLLVVDTLLPQASLLIQQNPQAQVLVQGDQAVPYAQVMKLMVTLQEAGAQRVGLVTESEMVSR